MKAYQKAALLVSIVFCLFYSLYILLDVAFPLSFLSRHPFLEGAAAFLAGLCAFINILLFKKQDM